MLDPTGVMAAVNSAIALFDTIRSVIEYINEILAIVDRYVATIAAVAKGNIGPGAAMIESGLASAVPVALGFIANLLHLDDVPDKIREIILGLRELIDQAIEWLFDQAMALGKAALEALGLGEEQEEGAAVKAKAKGLIDERTQGPIAKKEDLDTIAAGVLDELRPEGLKDVTVVEESDHPGLFDVSVVASPPTLAKKIPLGTGSGVAMLKLALLLPTAPKPLLEGWVKSMTEAGKSDDEMVTLVEKVRVGLSSPEMIKSVLDDIVKAAGGSDGIPVGPLKMKVWRPGGITNETFTLNLDPGSIEDRLMHAVLQLSHRAAGGERDDSHIKLVVLLTPKPGSKEAELVNGVKFFEQVVSQGFRFLDVAVNGPNGSPGHGATAHLIQDLVVDKVLKSADAPFDAAAFRTHIGIDVWESIYDSLDKDLHDPNALFPVIKEIIGEFEAAVTNADKAAVGP